MTLLAVIATLGIIFAALFATTGLLPQHVHAQDTVGTVPAEPASVASPDAPSPAVDAEPSLIPTADAPQAAAEPPVDQGAHPATDAAAAPSEIDAEYTAIRDRATRGDISLDELATQLIALVESTKQVPAGVPSLREQLPGFEQLLAPVLVDTIARRLSDQPPADLEILRELARKALSAGSEELALVDRLFTLAVEAESAATSGNKEALVALGERVQSPAEKTVLSKRLASLSQESEEEILKAEDPFAALKKLSQLAGVFRSAQSAATLEKLIVRILERVKSGELDFEKWTLDDPTVRTVLTDAVVRNPSLKQPLVELYEARLMDSLRSQKTENLTSYYGTILALRPDPNPENDRLRLNIAVYARSEDAKHFALGRLEELKERGALTLRNKLWLVARGYYGWTQPILFLVLWLLIIGLAVVFIVRPKFLFGWIEVRRKEIEAQERREREAEEYYRQKRSAAAQLNVSQRKLWVQPDQFDERRYDTPGYARGLSSEDEYSKLLKFFGLDDEASEDDIKRAYRDMVKQHHPDNLRKLDGISPEQVEAAELHFIKIKETYDRILEMRGSWFGSRK